jgi:hypothetical protein
LSTESDTIEVVEAEAETEELENEE